MKMNWRKWIALLTLVVALLLTALWQIGYIGLWNEGMAYIANDTKISLTKAVMKSKGNILSRLTFRI